MTHPLLHLHLLAIPPLVIGRALDVLNALGSTREEFQAPFRPGPGDIEELSPELWEELRLDSAGAEYELLGRGEEYIGEA